MAGQTVLPVVCAWCPGFVPVKRVSGQVAVSHGICASCKAKLDRQMDTREANSNSVMTDKG